jgi:chemotaxis protein CheC
MTPIEYTDLQLDALRELANIGSGTAGTALSQLLGRPVDISVPTAAALPLADAVDAAGNPEDAVFAVVMPIFGDLDGDVLLMFPPEDAKSICALLGVDVTTEEGRSAIGEICNILGTSYVNALAQMTGLEVEPRPPATTFDMIGAIVSTVLAQRADGSSLALMLDSELIVEGEACSLSFMLLPSQAGVCDLLERVGVA